MFFCIAPAFVSAAQTDSATANTNALASLATQAQAALDRKDYAAAIPLLQQIIVARPADALPHFELGYAYSGLKRYDEAAAEYRRAIELNPALAPAHLNLGLVLIESDPGAALASFRQAAELTPDQAQPRYLAGLALERAGKLPDAIEEYQAAVRLAPKDEAMRFVLARALLSAGRAADAESEFRAAIAAQPDATPAKLGLAEALLSENKLADAADAFAAYLAAAPDDRSARYERAAVLHDLTRFDDALAELDRADQGASPTTKSLRLRGSIYMEQKKWAAAGNTIEQAVAASPTDVELHAWLGHIKLELSDFPAAQRELLRTLILDPAFADSASVDSMRDLVTVYYLSGQYPATLAETDLLAKHAELTESNWFFRALACDKLNRKAEAATAYQKFLDLDRGQHGDQDWQAQQRLNVLLRETKNK